MKPRIIRVIDAGAADDVAKSSTFICSLIDSLTTNEGAPTARFEYVRLAAPVLLVAALQEPADVVHVVAHGASSPEEVGVGSEDADGWVELPALSTQLQDSGHGIWAPVIFMDTCDSARGRFVRVIRDCIEGDITYIGARASVGWYQSTTFGAAFYSALLRNKGAGVSPLDRGHDAADRANNAFAALTDKVSPFAVSRIRPTRDALRAFRR